MPKLFWDRDLRGVNSALTSLYIGMTIDTKIPVVPVMCHIHFHVRTVLKHFIVLLQRQFTQKCTPRYHVHVVIVVYSATNFDNKLRQQMLASLGIKWNHAT